MSFFSHPDPNSFAVLVGEEGAASPERIAALRHVLACPKCRRLLSDVLLLSEETEPDDLPYEDVLPTQDQAPIERFMFSLLERPAVSERAFAAEREAAAPLYDHLMELSPGARLAAVEVPDSPYATAALASLLLDASCESASTPPDRIHHLASLAAVILDHERLAGTSSSRINQLHARANVILADAHRRRGRPDTAEELLNTAALLLKDEPFEISVRAEFCRVRGLVSWDFEHIDDALGLLARGAEIAEAISDFHLLARLRCLQGSLLDDELEFEKAYSVFLEAYHLIDPEGFLASPPKDLDLALDVLDGLLRLAAEPDLNYPEPGLVSLLQILQAFSDTYHPDPLDIQWIRAQVDHRRGDTSRAIGRLLPVFRGRLEQFQGVEAAVTALQIARWSLERATEAPSPLDLTSISLLRKALDEAPAHSLPPALAPAVLFALDCPSLVELTGYYMEALSNAMSWLGRARFNFELPYTPTREPDLILPWNEYPLEVRRTIADRFRVSLTGDGLPETTEGASLLTWAHEVQTGNRIVFAAPFSAGADRLTIPLDPANDLDPFLDDDTWQDDLPNDPGSSE